MNKAILLLSFIGLCLLGLELANATNVNYNEPSVALTRQAVELGMEPAVLSELWRTKQPVIITKPDALGQLCTTTYELSAEGQNIIKTTVKEKPLVATTPISTAAVQPTNPQTDWEYLPASMSNRRTYTLSSTSPLGGNWPGFESGLPDWTNWLRDNNRPSFEFPAGVTPQTSTKTEKDDQGRTITTTTKTFEGPVTSNWGAGTELGANWPNFAFPAGVTPQISTTTGKDDQGRTITTTTRTYKGPVITRQQWTTGTELGPNWPSFAFPAGVTPQTTTNIENDDQGRTVTTTTNTFRGTVSTNEQPRHSIFEHPLPHWLNNPRSVDRPTAELPSFTSTAAPPPNQSENIPLPTPAPKNAVDGVDSGIRTTTPLPSLEDFLKESGTQTTPKVEGLIPTRNRNNFNGFVPLPTPPSRLGISRTGPSIAGPSITGNAEASEQSPQQNNDIDNFLSQVHLSPEQILAQNGEVVKTIIDKDGRVLSARFVLSTVKGNEQGYGQGRGQGQSELPTK